MSETAEKLPNHSILNPLIEEELPTVLVSNFLTEEGGITSRIQDVENSTWLISDDKKIEIKPVLPSYINSNEIEKKRNLFLSLQKWEGNILSVKNDSFQAELVDLTNKGSKELIELQKEDVPLEDKHLIKVGAIFYWTIGYEDYNGQRKKTSIIRFRRLPKLSVKEVERSVEKFKKLSQRLFNE